jgi:DNA-binding CsgD family transcriptional regulator
VLAGHHQRSADAAARVLGPDRYAELHARGAGLPLDQVVEFAVAGGDALPGGPRPGVVSLSGRPLLGVPEPRAASDDVARRPAGRADAEELTGREREIAAFVALGLPNRDIAARLFISRRTVDAHINHIFAKLGLSSRVQLANWARDRFAALPPSAASASAASASAASASAASASAVSPSALTPGAHA